MTAAAARIGRCARDRLGLASRLCSANSAHHAIRQLSGASIVCNGATSARTAVPECARQVRFAAGKRRRCRGRASLQNEYIYCDDAVRINEHGTFLVCNSKASGIVRFGPLPEAAAPHSSHTREQAYSCFASTAAPTTLTSADVSATMKIADAVCTGVACEGPPTTWCGSACRSARRTT